MARRRKGLPIHGWVNFDKPEGMTSTAAVGKIRRLFNAQKAGHAGTLDPLAQGILPIALGEATKTVPFMMEAVKTYRFTVRWGLATTTDDREGDVLETSEHRPTDDDIEAVLGAFVGNISQVPPAFSAIKIDGRRAYDMARAGEAPEISARNVLIDRLSLVNRPNRDSAHFEVECGKGTYVRSLARDMAEKLGTLGHVSYLRRVRVGPFNEKNTIGLDILDDLGHIAAEVDALDAVNPQLRPHLLPLQTVLDDIPALPVNEKEARDIRMGRAVNITAHVVDDKLSESHGAEQVLVLSDNHPVALGKLEEGRFQPVRVFNLSDIN